MTDPALSIVVPVYNEARVLPELVERCARAAGQHGLRFELVIVDDASTDDTPALLAELVCGDPRLRPCRLAVNVGQSRATRAGLREARGSLVVVLDGDLQDPPELIPKLVQTLTDAPESVLAVLAVKSRRDDPTLFMAGQYVFHRLQQWLGRVDVPPGAGSYCAMRREVARRVALTDFGRANLGSVVALTVRVLGGKLGSISYEKGRRYDDQNRVGWRGLAVEAMESLALSGALSRLLALAAVVLAAGGLACGRFSAGRSLLWASAALAAAGAGAIAVRARRILERVRTVPVRGG